MSLERLARILAVLAIIALGMYVVEKVWGALLALRYVILLFVFAALLAYFLQPIVDWLAALRAPRFVVERVRPRGPRVAAALERFVVGNGVAVAIVYLGLLLVIVLTGLYFVPLTVRQVAGLDKAIPGALNRLPQWLADADKWLSARSINLNLSSLYNPAALQSELQGAAGQLVRYAVTIAATVGQALAAALLILVISFYMMVDGRKLSRELSRLVPPNYHPELRFTIRTMDSVFGGFARVQVLMSVLYGLGVAIVMAIAGIPYGFAVSWFCGLIMLVPLLGAPVAMFLPALVTLILAPSAALWVLIVLVVYQNVLLHFLGPRVQSQSIGLPTLLVIAATLVGGILLGVWGVIIGVPVAAILYALAFHFVRRSQLRARAAEPPFGPDAASAAPAGDACGPDERPD